MALTSLWLAMLTFGAGAVDRTLLIALYAGSGTALGEAARLVTHLGDGPVVTVFAITAGLFLLLRGHPRRSLALVAGTLIGRALVELQKVQFGRLRPDENPHLAVVQSLSFPSGHSANAMLVYVILALMLVEDPKRRSWCVAGALLIALLVGLSRILLGVHWPSDVIGGWAFGLLWAMLILWMAHRLEPRLRYREDDHE